MARLFIVALCLTHAAGAFAAPTDPQGTWLGTLDAGVMKLRLGMECLSTPTGNLSVTFISIDQGGARIPSADPGVTDGELVAPLPMVGGEFRGRLNEAGDAIEGAWKQPGAALPLRLERVDRLPTQRRPQEPKPRTPTTWRRCRSTIPTGATRSRAR